MVWAFLETAEDEPEAEVLRAARERANMVTLAHIAGAAADRYREQQWPRGGRRRRR